MRMIEEKEFDNPYFEIYFQDMIEDGVLLEGFYFNGLMGNFESVIYNECSGYFEYFEDIANCLNEYLGRIIQDGVKHLQFIRGNVLDNVHICE